MINDSFDNSKPLFSHKDSYEYSGVKSIEKVCIDNKIEYIKGQYTKKQKIA